MKLVEVLDEAKIYGNFDITHESFAYEPSTQRYVFIDIDKLQPKYQKEEHKFNTTTFKVYRNFLKSLENEKIVLSEDHIKKLEGFDYVEVPYSKNLISDS